MSGEKLFSVITTIQPPTQSVKRFAAELRKVGAPLLLIGDTRGPASYLLEGAELLDIEAQRKLDFRLAPLLPTGHYARKNLGYLVAMQRGAQVIYETDDDNAPMDSWSLRSRTVAVRPWNGGGKWVNVYRAFTDEFIWPRGFPLDKINEDVKIELGAAKVIDAPVQQGIVNHSPDVDAVWRLVADRPLSFSSGPSVLLPRDSWCPFNSQSTWWWPPAFPLMYLPSFCSFRMTDIWRSFIAQRCLWEIADGIVFHEPEVLQERNDHDLLKDFADEVPGYLNNAAIARTLADLNLESGKRRFV